MSKRRLLITHHSSLITRRGMTTAKIPVIVSTTMKIAFIKPPIGGILGLEMLTFVQPPGPIFVAACLEADGPQCKVYDPRLHREETGLPACQKFGSDVL